VILASAAQQGPILSSARRFVKNRTIRRVDPGVGPCVFLGAFLHGIEAEQDFGCARPGPCDILNPFSHKTQEVSEK